MAGGTSTAGASVTSRALALLAAFDEHHRVLRLSELATRAGLPVPTAHRLVAELTEWGALSRRPDGRYRIGRRLWDLGMLAAVQADLQEVASPFLHDLYAATLATVHLAVRVDDQVLYIDRLGGHSSVPVVSTIGSRLPMHATGVGKVLLAYAPEDIQRRVLSDLTRITPHTITEPGRIHRQLARVREEGFAVTSEEMSMGAASVAVPVLSRNERVVAALGVVVPPRSRDKPQLVAALKVAAQGIRRSL